jgi:hypothetical protein
VCFELRAAIALALVCLHVLFDDVEPAKYGCYRAPIHAMQIGMQVIVQAVDQK